MASAAFPPGAASTPAAAAVRLDEFSNLHAILGQSELFMGLTDSGGNLCTYSTFLQWMFMQPECGNNNPWGFGTAPLPPTAADQAAAPVPRVMCTKAAAMDVAERIIKKHLTDLSQHIEAGGTKTATVKQTEFLTFLTTQKWKDSFRTEFPMRTGTNRVFYSEWFANILGFTHGEFRQRLGTGGRFIGDNVKQCTGALNQPRSDFVNTNCYLCGMPMTVEDVMECEHILPFCTGIRILWLAKSTYENDIKSILNAEYLWAHACCNQRKEAYEFFKFDEVAQKYVMFKPRDKSGDSGHLMYKDMVSHGCPNDPRGTSLTYEEYMTQYDAIVGPMIAAIVTGINNEIDERFGGWGYMYVVYTLLKIFACLTKKNFNSIYGDPGEDDAGKGAAALLKRLQDDVTTANYTLESAKNELDKKIHRMKTSNGRGDLDNNPQDVLFGFERDKYKFAYRKHAAASAANSRKNKNPANQAIEDAAKAELGRTETDFITYLLGRIETLPFRDAIDAAQVSFDTADQALKAHLASMPAPPPPPPTPPPPPLPPPPTPPPPPPPPTPTPPTGGSKIMKGGTLEHTIEQLNEKWPHVIAHGKRLLGSNSMTPQQQEFLEYNNLTLNGMQIEFGIEPIHEGGRVVEYREADNMNEKLLSTFHELNNEFMYLCRRGVEYEVIEPTLKTILVVKLLIDIPHDKRREENIERLFELVGSNASSIDSIKLYINTNFSIIEIFMLLDERKHISIYSKQHYLIYVLLLPVKPAGLLEELYRELIDNTKNNEFIEAHTRTERLYYLLIPFPNELKERKRRLQVFYERMRTKVGETLRDDESISTEKQLDRFMRSLTQGEGNRFMRDIYPDMFTPIVETTKLWQITGLKFFTPNNKGNEEYIDNIVEIPKIPELVVVPYEKNGKEYPLERATRLHSMKLEAASYPRAAEARGPRASENSDYEGQSFGGPGAAADRGQQAAASLGTSPSIWYQRLSHYMNEEYDIHNLEGFLHRLKTALGNEDISEYDYRRIFPEIQKKIEYLQRGVYTQPRAAAARDQREEEDSDFLKAAFRGQQAEFRGKLYSHEEEAQRQEEFQANKYAKFQARAAEREAAREAARDAVRILIKANEEAEAREAAVSQHQVERYLGVAEEGRESARDAASREAEIYAATGDRRKKRETEGSENSSGKKLLLTPFDPTRRVVIPSPFKPPPQRRNVTLKALRLNSVAQQQRNADADYRKKEEFNKKSDEESKRLSSLISSNSGELLASIQQPERPTFRRQNSGELLASIQQPKRPTFRRQNSGELLASILPHDDSIIVNEEGERNEAVREGRKRQETESSKLQVETSGVSRTRGIGGKLINKTKKTKHRQFRKTKHRQIRKTKHRQIRKTKHRQIRKTKQKIYS